MQQEPFTLPDEVTVISIITNGTETATIAVPRTPHTTIYDHDGNAWATDARTTDPDWLGVASHENLAKYRAAQTTTPGQGSTATPADPIIAKLAALKTSAEIDAAIEDDDTLLDIHQDDTTEIRDLLDSLIREARTTAALLPGGIDAQLRGLTEDGAWKILFAMAHKFDWIPCVWSMGDVMMIDDDDEESGPYSASDADVPLNDAERIAVASTWEWRRGIIDYASERVADMDMIPEVKRHYGPGGEQTGFTVRTGYDGSVRYDMDGNEVQG